MRSTHASGSCPTCNTFFDRLPVERDEDGGFVVLEMTPCAACGTLLCGACSRFACDGCGLTHCASHLVAVPDGTPDPLKCCAPCAAECEPLPFAMPMRRETRPALVAKGAA